MPASTPCAGITAAAPVPTIAAPLALTEEPAANVDRYDGLRQQSEAEADHVR